ncbi:protein STAY-GREEN 1, chloroplastic [Sesamum alatum]|uniref:Protein STAY-GREEN 1, chloroplastic n=1 Tax=Sesamum alatum TaxID=300844 RepID=A0AAE1YS86_9LAMI|nr:protein STAY-GREEN 1, chloroplastic [Sesamum alatum]
MSNFRASLLPSKENHSFFLHSGSCRGTTLNKNVSIIPVARLFGPATFEASKLRVVFLGIDKEKHPAKLPRTYTLTHCDFTSNLTLAISQTTNTSQLQGWYNKLQRDEVVGEWKKIKGKMCLDVHCHISGAHFLLDLFANLRYYIFCEELPVVLKAFVHGDKSLFNSYPELQEALAWIHFHSNIPEFNKVECWGPLCQAKSPSEDLERLLEEAVRKGAEAVLQTIKGRRWGPRDQVLCRPPAGREMDQDSVGSSRAPSPEKGHDETYPRNHSELMELRREVAELRETISPKINIVRGNPLA